jgi:aspartyl-tRNA synthetase
MNKHLDILSLCLFATQNQQGNPRLNTSSLEVHAEKIEVHVRTAVLPCDKKQNIPFWKILIKHQ